MKKFFVLAISILFLLTGLAMADTLQVGANYTDIYSIWQGQATVLGGGSVDPAYLNGTQLEYMYCVDITKYIYVPGTYSNTLVNNTGNIYGNPLQSAGQIAWLLSNYGTGGQGDAAYALQAAIWHVIYGDLYTLDTIHSTAYQTFLYNTYLTALGSNTGDVSAFLWITPGSGTSIYQGQVGAVTEPATILLIGLGLMGLAGVRRKLKN